MVGAEAAALEKGGFERGGEGEGAAEDADGALAADAPLVAVEAERDAGPDEDVGQDLAGPGPDLGPVGQDLDGERRLGHRLLLRLRGPILNEIPLRGNPFLARTRGRPPRPFQIR